MCGHAADMEGQRVLLGRHLQRLRANTFSYANPVILQQNGAVVDHHLEFEFHRYVYAWQQFHGLSRILQGLLVLPQPQ